MRGIDETGAVDPDIEAGNNILYRRALLILLTKAGGRLKITPREIQLMPLGSLAFAMTEEALTFAYTLQPLNADIEKHAASLPDTSVATANNVIIRQALAIITINAGYTLTLTAADLEASQRYDWNIRFDATEDGGYHFWLEKA